MGGYWGKVWRRAWIETKQSFGWNLKTLATALIAGAGGFVTSRLGMIASATAIFSAAIAILLLFAWNFFSAQAKLYAELSQTSGDKIRELEGAFARIKGRPPDYAAWRHVDELTIWQAAFLWCDLEPSSSSQQNAIAWRNALVAAVKKGELEFVHQPAIEGISIDGQPEYEKKNARSDTIVTRSALQEFAKRHNHDPTFLRDA
jgi:hypothetical protein